MKVLTILFEGRFVGSYLIPKDEFDVYKEALEYTSEVDNDSLHSVLYEIDSLFEKVELEEVDVYVTSDIDGEL